MTAASPGLLSRARYPADKRPLQVFNNEALLSALHSAGVPTRHLLISTGPVGLRAEDLVEGDRERTLALLWEIALRVRPDLLPCLALCVSWVNS